MRKLLVAIALMLGVVFIVTQMAEVQAIADTLQRGDWRFLLLALGLEIGWLLINGAIYRTIYRALGIEERVGRLMSLAAAAYFVNVVAPTAGVGGVAVFISDARQRGYSAARATVAGVLFVLFDYAAFFVVLALGLVVLFRRNNLNPAELIASGVLVVVAVSMGTVIFLGMRSEQALARLLAWAARQVNRTVRPLLRREYLAEARAYTFAHDVAAGLKRLDHRPETLFVPGVLALLNKGLLVTILLLMFMAFKVPFSVGTLVAGFSIGYLFLIVSPTPAGLGVVEGALTLALRSLRVPLGDAAVLTLAYRGITFWAPLLIGMIAFRWLSHSNQAHRADLAGSSKE